MSNKNSIEKEFTEKVCKQIRLHEQGSNRYRVFSPFRFDDGDHLVITLEKEINDWYLTDLGHTYMHITYDIDENKLHEGTRQEIISSTLDAFGIEDIEGELRVPIEDEKFGNALYDFIQGILRINDVKYLTREMVVSTFMDDFRSFFKKEIPEQKREFEWNHRQYDPNASYPADCRISDNGKPLMVFALHNDTKTRDATITLHQYEKWGLEFQSLSIFENQEEINRKVLARYSDVSNKMFSNLNANQERIHDYINKVLSKKT